LGAAHAIAIALSIFAGPVMAGPVLLAVVFADVPGAERTLIATSTLPLCAGSAAVFGIATDGADAGASA
jgi:hypothetical protein